MMKGAVLNIQKFSLHDGPGIRTVVFLKGCPLRCAWCANPESQGAPMGAQMHIDEVMRVCMQDAPFYADSGGGVTLSGGEVLMQPAFAAALLGRLNESGIHTAIETTGFAAPDVFDAICARTKLILFDVKHWDETRHMEGTGTSLMPIIANLQRATAAGRKVLVRIPVIPGYNDDINDAIAFGSLLRGAGIDRAQLLPFHQFGEGKYEQLGRTYAYAGADVLHEENLVGYRDALIGAGSDTFF